MKPPDVDELVSGSADPVTLQDESQPRRPGRKTFALIALVPVVIGVSAYYNIDIIGWFTTVVNHIRDIPPRYILLAVTLKSVESILAAVAWRNILRAAYPESPISFRRVFGAYQGGVGINAVTPANAGTLVTLGLFRVLIPGAGIAGILSATLVQNLVFGLIAVLTGIALVFTNPIAVDTIVDAVASINTFLDTHEAVLWVAGVTLAILAIVGVVWVRRRVSEFWEQAARGGAILRTPRRYLLGVALPQLLSYACRWGITMTFFAAFDIPISARSVFLAIGSNTLANAVQIAPGGVGTTEAIMIISLRSYAEASTVTAFSLSQSTILTSWNLMFGFFALVLAFGISGARNILRQRATIAAEMQTQGTDG